MKALFYLGPERLELREIGKPKGDVVIKILGAGVCGTDLKTYLKGHPMFKPPTILGHECYGKIVELNVDMKSLEVGDTVAVAPYAECGKCDLCETGVPELCKSKTYLETGCFTQYIAVSREHASRALFKVTDDPAQILAEPLACVFNGFEKLRVKPRRLLVVGGGPMGVLFALLGVSEGCETFVIEKSAWRLEHIRSLGIEAADTPPEGLFDGIIFAVNIPELVGQYTRLANDGGSLLLFSGYPKDSLIEVDSYAVHYREVSVVGGFGFALRHFERAVQTLSSQVELFRRLMTHRFDLENAPKAFEILSKGEAMKVFFGM